MCDVGGCDDGFFDAVGAEYGTDFALKEVYRFAVIGTHADDGADFLAYYGFDCGVVIAFVHAADDEYDGFCHGFECPIDGVHVGGFAVVDVFDAVDSGYFFESVRNIYEGIEAALNVGR